MKNYFVELCRAISRLRNNRRLCVATLVAVVAATVIPRHIGILLTPSLDHRFFWVSRNPSHVGRGDYVHFTDPELARKVGNPDTPDIFKRIRCDEGDILIVDAARRFFCNGEFIGTAKDHSLKGEKMRYFAFHGRIPAGSMFVMGEHRDSYDSRYFGLVDKSRIRARVYPVF